MHEDFASRFGDEHVRPSMSNRQLAASRMVKPVMLGAAGFIAAMFTLMLMLVGDNVDASVPITREEWLDVNLADVDGKPTIAKVVLNPGDAAATALERLGFGYTDVAGMIDTSRHVYSLKRVNAGQSFWRQDETSTNHVYYNIDGDQRLHLYMHDGENWQAELQPRIVHTRQVRVSGEISEALFPAALAAGLDERTTMNLVDIFSWDIDFARDLRSGDRFSVLFEEQFDESGKLLGTTILSAEFVNQGETYRAIRYELADGRAEYFAPDGSSMRKTYLKSPVKFSRISSRFSSSRKHPVLGYTRAHRGVDYAAASGTPVRAIGDGYVTYSGRKGGYGNVVEIRHTNSSHTTAYAHLRSYGRGVHRGIKVKQGQIIGYVGMSGLATGPHLHFEFRVRGRAVNPLSVRHSPARPVPEAERAQFSEVAEALTMQLSMPMVALAWE